MYITLIFRQCLAVRHSEQLALWLVKAVVCSGATRLASWRAMRVVKSIFALKRVV